MGVIYFFYAFQMWGGWKEGVSRKERGKRHTRLCLVRASALLQLAKYAGPTGTRSLEPRFSYQVHQVGLLACVDVFPVDFS